MSTSVRSSSLNVGRFDRRFRVSAGVVVLLLALFALEGLWALVAGVVGLILVITGFVGFCPLYRLLGMNTGSSS